MATYADTGINRAKVKSMNRCSGVHFGMENAKVHFLSDPAHYREKERCYLEVRSREGRILRDEEVLLLPNTLESNPYAREWAMRRRSFSRLERYLARRSRGKYIRILDLGCGNGWMANRLAGREGREVWAVDLNAQELRQGARLFGRGNLHFVYADLASPNGIREDSVMPFRDKRFDFVILAASAQYFPDFPALISILRSILKPSGEIHITDSPFYGNEAERAAARQRTLEYYARVGVPEMADYYYHHLLRDAKDAGAKNLNNQLIIKILQKMGLLTPFPWLVLRQV